MHTAPFPYALIDIIEAGLNAHLSQGDPCVFSWAIYRGPQDAGIQLALSPSSPPNWIQKGGSQDELHQARLALGAIITAQGYVPEDMPSVLPGVRATPGNAHARLQAAKTLAGLTARP